MGLVAVVGVRRGGAAVRGEAESGRVGDVGETLPVSHGLDHRVVSMDSGVDTLLPLAVDFAGIAADIGVMGLAERHRLRTAVTVGANTLRAVALAVGNAHSAVVHEGVG